jgi:hypothetical protein
MRNETYIYLSHSFSFHSFITHSHSLNDLLFFFSPEELIGTRYKRVDCYLLLNCRADVITFTPHTSHIKTPHFIVSLFIFPFKCEGERESYVFLY